MGCGCKKQTDDKRNYDNQKRLAQIYADDQQKVIILYRDSSGLFSFIEWEAVEGIEPVEFVLPM